MKRTALHPSALSATDLDGPRIWHGVWTELAPEFERPFPIDALVVEDDTWQVLGADPDFHPSLEHPIRVMQALHEAQPVAPGSVVVGGGSPTRLHAIVHDLDLEPTWTKEWIGTALEGIFRIASERGLSALGLPLLGTRHGRLSDDLSLRLIDGALARSAKGSPRRLWLIAR